MHASPIARNFSLCDFYLLGPFHFICFKSRAWVFLALGVVNAGSRVDRGIKHVTLIVVTNNCKAYKAINESCKTCKVIFQPTSGLN